MNVTQEGFTLKGGYLLSIIYVLTMVQMKKRGSFKLASRCPLCKGDEENIDHLLLHYPSVWGFWAAIIYFFAKNGLGMLIPG